MRTGNAMYLALSLILPLLSLLSSAAPVTTPGVHLVRPGSVTLTLSLGTNTTRQVTLPKQPYITPPYPTQNNILLTYSTTSFPPGSPPEDLRYHIPLSDLTIQLSPLGHILGRDESLVERVLNTAFRASLNPFRPSTAMSRNGYQLQDGSFLISVIPSVRRTRGEQAFTWGMWSEVLMAMFSYVETYPGYDFSYNIWWTPEDQEKSEEYVVGSGFAMTRR